MANDSFYCTWNSIIFYSDAENVTARHSYVLIASINCGEIT